MRIVHADSCDPDDISYEAWIEDRCVLVISADVDGNRAINFGDLQNLEFDSEEFRDLICEGVASLADWEAKLREENGPWAAEKGPGTV